MRAASRCSCRVVAARIPVMATVTALSLAASLIPGAAFAQHGHAEAVEPPVRNMLSPATRELARTITVQDYQGRMKPLDTLAREMVMKITKRSRYGDWDPVDLFLSWMARPEYWFEAPLLYVRYPGLKDLLGVGPETSHVSAFSLLDQQGHYVLHEAVEEALRTPDASRSKLQRKLLSFDERFNLFNMTLRGLTFRAYPVPGDENETWLEPGAAMEQIDPELQEEFRPAILELFEGLRDGDDARIRAGLAATAALQDAYGSEVRPGPVAQWAELFLNRMDPFRRLILPYLLAAPLLIAAYLWTVARRGNAPYNLKNPLYGGGLLIFWGSVLAHALAFVLRWIASGRAPLSNGFESLIFISLMVGVAGVLFEARDRRGAAAGLASLLTGVVLGVSMMSAFDPAIGPLVPVLASYWLNIHVTVITASYGFLGLGALLGGLVLILLLGKAPGRGSIRAAVDRLDRLIFNVVVTGLGLLSVGTMLGGVWANESWGRYWGWDPKETWSFVTILVYAVVLHLRWIPSLKRPWVLAAGSFAAIASVMMTYFGVNYFLTGLHSYAQGEAARVPAWVFVGSGLMGALILLSWWRDRRASWE